MTANEASMGRGAGPNAARRSLEEARRLLSEGRHGEALAAVRGARRRGQAQPRILDLLECEALLRSQRHPEALALATRSLSRPGRDTDLAVRLRAMRAHALWLTGRSGPARLEIERALVQSDVPLTRARAFELLALFAWKAHDPDTAARPLESALELYAASGSREGTIRALGIRAGLLRDAGRLEEALAIQSHRLELARSGSRRDLVAVCEAERASLLAALGRWREAARGAESSADIFRALGDPREATLAGAVWALVCLAAGDLPAAQILLGAAQEALGQRVGQPRARIEHLLLWSDLSLAAGDAVRANEAAVEALRLSVVIGDRAGQSRSRVRCTQALLAQGRVREAVAEARRARKAAPPTRSDLVALAGLTLGRALLRTDRRAAAEAFAQAMAVEGWRSGPAVIARGGRALAASGTGADPEVAASLAALEAWGDRRLLAYSLSDLRAVAGEEPAAAGLPSQPMSLPADSATSLIAEAAHALAGDGPWPERWAAAMRAVRPALPWWRAALVGESAWELRADLTGPVPLPADDLARRLAEGCETPVVVDLSGDPRLRRHPTRVLHGLGTALLAPVEANLILYADVREERGDVGQPALDVLVALARLLSRYRPTVSGGGGSYKEDEEAALPGIVGRCPPMRDLFRTVERAAMSDLTIHVCGETGTGKEKVAETLHRLSRRGQGPFVTLNASSLSDDLFESEMYGHIKGSFTGAVADRMGHVAEAEGGTLFLDEVTDLTPRAQAKLLRLLEQKEYRRLGEATLRRADVRFVTASNLPLATCVDKGRFRADLMYRLNRIVVVVPPLRERGDDFRLLARHFLRRAATRARVEVPSLPPDLERRLVRYSWPGNVRELENEMDRWVALSDGGPIRPEHLSPGLLTPSPARLAASLKDALLAFEKDHIERVLNLLGGNRARTASLLGLSRQALVAKISRLGISSVPSRGGTATMSEGWAPA